MESRRVSTSRFIDVCDEILCERPESHGKSMDFESSKLPDAYQMVGRGAFPRYAASKIAPGTLQEALYRLESWLPRAFSAQKAV